MTSYGNLSPQLSEILKKNAFPNAPLDEKDRQIIKTSYKHGDKGIGFNKFVRELAPFVSRSTVAFRVSRLSKLGYLERVGNESRGGSKPVRVSFKCFSILSILDQMQEKTSKLVEGIREEADERNVDVGSLGKSYDALRKSWNGCFSMIGSVAMLYGERAAADLFLPLLMEDYRKLVSEFFSLLEKRPDDLKLVQQIIGERFAKQVTSVSSIKKKVFEQQKKWNVKNPD